MFMGGMGFLGVKAINWGLLKAFFSETQKRAGALAAHRQNLRPAVTNKGARQLRLLYSDGGLLGWHSPLIAPSLAPAGELVAECHITGNIEGQSLKRLLFNETVRERIIEKLRLETHVNDESLEQLGEVHREFCQVVKTRGYFRTRIALERLHEGTFRMSMDNEPLYYSVESLPEAHLAVPHERLRSLVIDEDGML